MGLAPAALSARTHEFSSAAVVRARAGFAPATVSVCACARLRLYMRKMLSLRNNFYDVLIFCFKHLVSFCLSHSKYHAPMNLQFFDYTQRQKVCTEFLSFYISVEPNPK